MSVFINPYTDFGFKKLFGEEGNKDLLIDFLNPMLPPHHQIADLTFQNVEALPDANSERKAFFDIHCKSAKGERFIVEMQKAKVKHFKDRSLYYITYPIREQAVHGDWDFQLSAIYFIAVLDFWYDDDPKTAKFMRTITFKDQDNDPFYDKLQLTYLQMKAFNKTETQLETQMDKWAYFLKNLENFEDIPQILNEPVFNRAFQTAKLANYDKTQRDEYEQSRLTYIGAREMINTAAEEGKAEGIEIGKAKGIEIGEARGIEIGKAKAELEKEQMILEMESEGFTVNQIAKIAKKTEAEVQQIITKNKE